MVAEQISMINTQQVNAVLIFVLGNKNVVNVQKIQLSHINKYCSFNKYHLPLPLWAQMDNLNKNPLTEMVKGFLLIFWLIYIYLIYHRSCHLTESLNHHFVHNLQYLLVLDLFLIV